jgi:hypothetical protein
MPHGPQSSSSQQALAPMQKFSHCCGSLPLHAQKPWALQLPLAQLLAT